MKKFIYFIISLSLFSCTTKQNINDGRYYLKYFNPDHKDIFSNIQTEIDENGYKPWVKIYHDTMQFDLGFTPFPNTFADNVAKFEIINDRIKISTASNIYSYSIKKEEDKDFCFMKDSILVFCLSPDFTLMEYDHVEYERLNLNVQNELINIDFELDNKGNFIVSESRPIDTIKTGTMNSENVQFFNYLLASSNILNDKVEQTTIMSDVLIYNLKIDVNGSEQSYTFEGLSGIPFEVEILLMNLSRFMMNEISVR